MPVFELVDYGTSYTYHYRISPLALYLIMCGWEVKQVVVPPCQE